MKKKLAAIIAALLIVALAVMLLLPKGQEPSAAADIAAAVTFLGLVDDADCMVFSKDGHHVMIDTGEFQDSPKILKFLEQQGITSLDCLILTHPDKDHIGSAAQVLDAVEVKQIVQTGFQKGSNLQAELNTAIQNWGGDNHVLQEREVLRFSGMDFTCYPPEEQAYEKDNNYSIIVLADVEGTTFLCAGDAEKKRLKEAANYSFPPIDLYKVAHHGRDNGESADFIEKIKPKYAVVTAEGCGEKVAGALKGCGTVIYSTDQGDVTVQVVKDELGSTSLVVSQ